MLTRLSILCCLLVCVALTGCSKKPPLYPVSGKITLGGKTYPRIICYFRPVKGLGNESNIGVGEVDSSGNLFVRCGAGEGIAAGEYRVTFSCMVTQSGTAVAGTDKPDDDSSSRVIELVPAPYDPKSDLDSPVRFTVTPSGNVFNYDIPTSKP